MEITCELQTKAAKICRKETPVPCGSTEEDLKLFELASPNKAQQKTQQLLQ
jgi:hypothetical protein